MRRSLRLGLLMGALVAGGALAFAGAQPQGYLGVSDAIAAQAGQEVHVKASVLEGSLRRSTSPVTFDLVEGPLTLEVRWDPAHPLPDHEAGGTIEGKNVVVHGVVLRDENGPYLLAHQMTVGCASKYRPAE